MNKKVVFCIITSVVLIGIIVGVVFFLSMNSKSENIKFNSNYKYYVEFKVKSDIMLLIDNNDKVSNVLYLNDEAVTSLANKKIEGKDYKKAIELIVDKMKNNNEFNNGDEFVVYKYKDDFTYSEIITELNKEFIIYGVDNKLNEKTNSLENKLKELKINSTSDSLKNLEDLYNYSMELLTK